MNKPQVDTICWDIDNTMWNWVAYAAEVYPAMCNVLSQASGQTRERVTDCMRKYYGRAETMESSWLVQDLEAQGLFREVDVDQSKLIKDVQRAFHASRTKSLRLYDQIPEVLEAIYRAEISSVIVTDAPACHAASRIKHLGLNQDHIQKVFAIKDSLPDEVPENHRDMFDGGNYGLKPHMHHLETGKPHDNLHELLGKTPEDMRTSVAFVGDSISKDMTHNCISIHAGWGRPLPEHLEKVSKFAPHHAPATIYRRQSFLTLIHASEPRDVLKFLNIE